MYAPFTIVCRVCIRKSWLTIARAAIAIAYNISVKGYHIDYYLYNIGYVNVIVDINMPPADIILVNCRHMLGIPESTLAKTWVSL